jgi:trimeric autotransporter adhesin
MPNLVGTGLNQVPTNGMLGGLAYQSPDHASIKDLDLKNLSQINSEIADTAVDIFIYDTSKDSDGGAWRKRTTHTSWYNETLNTATRGSRKEFPAVAVIVAESDAVTIYDGDDPDLPMWMRWEGNEVPGSAGSLIYEPADGNSSLSSICMKNGIMVYTDNGNAAGTYEVNFAKDSASRFGSSGEDIWQGTIADRQSSLFTNAFAGPRGGVVNWYANDSAITVLPNAPIDSATGLPIPTIAVATNGGVSIIKDDGSVVDVIDTNSARKCYDVSFTKDHKIMHTGDLGAGSTHAGNVFVTNVLTADRSEYDNHSDLYRWYSTSSMYPRINGGNTFNTRVLDPLDVGGHHYAMADVGISLIEDGTSSSYGNTDGMVAYATTSYNTGWMHGDIKGAFLSDTDDTNVTGTELHPNGNSDFSSTDVSYISNTASGTATVSSGQLVLSGGAANYSDHILTVSNLEVGSQYIITIDYISKSAGAGNIGFYVNGSYLPEVNDGSGYISRSTGNSYSFYFTTEFSSRTIDLVTGGSTSATHTFDNWSIKKVEEDRSVNNKGLQVFGTITKTPVATGSDLVAYSAWSSSNYMDNTSYAVNFGNPVTISIVFWQKITDIADYSYGVSFSHGNTVKGGISNGASSSSYPGQGYFNMGSQTLYTGSRVDDGNWHCLVGTISGTAKKFYLDGREVESATINNYDMSGISRIHVGSYGINHAYAHRGSLALLRVSKSAPSAAQVKKMYEDEKFLFQENAKCTLYGSSDAVTALAYDEVTERLHVGTSSGRSEFQGLRRINNTTTAVTTAISAYDSFVVEQ